MRALMLALAFWHAHACASYPEYRVPPELNVDVRRVTILSEGAPLVGHVLQAAERLGRRLPTVVICQGTGGLQHYHLHPALTLAKAGFTVITFDYRGWGRSRGRLIPADRAAPPRQDGAPGSVEAIEVRETVDPLEQARDVMAVMAWAMADPAVDAERIGLWGTSLGASIVLYVAAHEPRVRALVAQVGAYDLRRSDAAVAKFSADATARARGELPYPPPVPRVPGQLHGLMVREHYQVFRPYEDLARMLARPSQPAVLIIDAEHEKLFDIRQHGKRLYERLAGTKERVVLPGIEHYGIYIGEALREASRLAAEWFNRHLR